MPDKQTWWCADYPDGTVWPCELVAVSVFGVRVRPVGPAPDSGEVRAVAHGRVYDGALRRPTPADVPLLAL